MDPMGKSISICVNPWAGQSVFVMNIPFSGNHLEGPIIQWVFFHRFFVMFDTGDIRHVNLGSTSTFERMCV